ncbi:hypothetical protein ACS0Y7_33980, partial [Burkholderia gladioli]|uniref:hypothetical protein n=1 Tax=Burkholderia gladioli TaxID=28095 RepID=UPI003F7A8D8C
IAKGKSIKSHAVHMSPARVHAVQANNWIKELSIFPRLLRDLELIVARRYRPVKGVVIFETLTDRGENPTCPPDLTFFNSR